MERLRESLVFWRRLTMEQGPCQNGSVPEWREPEGMIGKGTYPAGLLFDTQECISRQSKLQANNRQVREKRPDFRAFLRAGERRTNYEREEDAP